MIDELNIKSNRKIQKYKRIELILRIIWMLGFVLFRFSPRTFFRWRSFLLRSFGAKVGHNVHIYNSAKIYMPWNLEIGNWSAIGEECLIYNLGKVIIGEKTTISHRAHICAGTHDYSDSELPLIKPPINIGDMAWICADAFVGPDVTVGEGAVVGARAVVTKNVDSWSIVAGNPACFIKKRELE